jgi:tetratricopeptide (TPR) repeat protein
MSRYGSSVRKSPEWRDAEVRYNQLHLSSSFSIVGVSPMPGFSLEDLDREFEEILQTCPRFFPALFHRGEYMLRMGNTSEGEKLIDRASDSLVEIVEHEQEFKQKLSFRIENLEKLLRYDLAARCLEKAVRLFPDTAEFYDDLAFCLLQSADRDKSRALRMQQQAIEIDRDNDFYINNLGWIHLVMGNYKEAEDCFRKAMDFNIDHPSAFKNLDMAEYMHDHRLSYFDYLLRSADMKELAVLWESGEGEEAAELCREYNADRIEAFKIHQIKNGEMPPHEILNILQPFEMFINSVEEEVAGDVFLFENIKLWCENSDDYFIQFVLGSDDVEEMFLEDLRRSFTVFYDFLREVKVIDTAGHKQFMACIDPLISKLSAKMDEFHRLRLDVTLDEAERRASINRLFGI